MPDIAQLSINTATLRKQWKLEDIIAGVAQMGIRGIAPWRDQVAQAGLANSARRIRDAGLEISCYCHGGMFPATERAGRAAARDDNRRAVDEALALGARCLVLVAGGLPRRDDGAIASKDMAGAREMVRDGIGELLDYARPAGMPLALEPTHPMVAAERGCVSTLAHANDLCDELAPRGADGLGIAVDVYQVWWDAGLEAEIKRAGAAERLLAYQISDWLVPTRDLANDRGMMGDGVIDLPLVRRWMEDAGYRGLHEVEIHSGRWWAEDPRLLLVTAIERHAQAT